MNLRLLAVLVILLLVPTNAVANEDPGQSSEHRHDQDRGHGREDHPGQGPTQAEQDEAPDAPQDVQAQHHDSVNTVSWSQVEDAEWYNVYRNGALISRVDGVEYTDPTGTQGDVYQISAANSEGESIQSQPVRAQSNGEPQPCAGITWSGTIPVFINVEQCRDDVVGYVCGRLGGCQPEALPIVCQRGSNDPVRFEIPGNVKDTAGEAVCSPPLTVVL